MLFRGSHVISIDAKGRIAIPTKYREDLNELSSGNLVITPDTEKCLLIYPTAQYEEIQRKIDSLPTLNAHVRKLQRLFVGRSADAEMDAQGRVLIPAQLREYAGLDKKAVLVGQNKKFELWDEETWNVKSTSWEEEGVMEDENLPPELANLIL